MVIFNLLNVLENMKYFEIYMEKNIWTIWNISCTCMFNKYLKYYISKKSFVYEKLFNSKYI